MPLSADVLTELGYPEESHKFMQTACELEEGLAQCHAEEGHDDSMDDEEESMLEWTLRKGAEKHFGRRFPKRKRSERDDKDAPEEKQHKSARLSDSGSRRLAEELERGVVSSRINTRGDLPHESTAALMTPSAGAITRAQQTAVTGTRSATGAKLGKVPPPPALPDLALHPDFPNRKTSVARAKRQRSPALEFTQPPEDSDVEIVVEHEQTKKMAAKPSMTLSTSVSPQKGPMKPPASKSGSKKKKWLWDDALKYVDKLGNAKDPNKHLYKVFPEIKDMVEFLAPIRPARTTNYLAGCRIAFVNANRRPNQPVYIRNRMDISLPLHMYNVIRNGGELVSPDDFVGSPPDAERSDVERAAREGWTTHVIVLLLLGGQYKPSFKEVLTHLGPNGVTLEQLGPFVQVVDQAWLGDRIAARDLKICREAEYTLQDDPRVERVKEQEQSRPPKQSTRPSPSDSEDGEEENIQDDAVSPFGEHDFPPGEVVKNDRDQPDAHGQAIEGLETELAYVRDAGIKAIDDELEYADKISKLALDDFMILSERDKDDNETEEENSDENTARATSKSPTKQDGYKVHVKPNGKKKHFKERPGGVSAYACDRSSTGGVHEASVNEDIAKVLERFASYYKGAGFRERGYKMAANALRSTPYRVDTYQLAIEIQSIGLKIAKRVVEIARFGKAAQLEYASNDTKLIELFSGIYNVGRPISEELIALGARSLDDLRRDPNKFRLTESQKLGLEYYDDLNQKIPREEVTELYNLAKKAARDIDPELEIYCMGSYRRGQKDCGDIDLLVTRNTFDGKTHRGMIGRLWTSLQRAGVARHVLTASDDLSELDAKVNALCSLPKGGKMRRLDILGVPYDELPAALIYFTGNDYFNRSMRLKARHFGYRLNQRGLYKDVMRDRNGKKVTEGVREDCKTEKDIFEKLCVPYRPPEQRLP
ncbi:hypothetical protein OIV83_002573 [Microbotryomycetes sp. JL201]|nr:hypothetical protein OIV83_002573 [Microbotryomycetes sp. JL201]